MITEKTIIRILGALDTMGADAAAADELDDAATISAARQVVRVLWTENVKLRAPAEPAHADAAPTGEGT
jgi:hypothetical protein